LAQKSVVESAALKPLETAFSVLRMHGRIIAYGGLSRYEELRPRANPWNLFNIFCQPASRQMEEEPFLPPIGRSLTAGKSGTFLSSSMQTNRGLT
jgi:hypothetical protein